MKTVKSKLVNIKMENKSFQFDESYTEYWKNIQQNSASNDSRKKEVPAEDVIEYFITNFEIKKEDKVLDLGCSYGRLFDSLSQFSQNIYGVDISLEAINKAIQFDYRCLIQGKAEETHFASNFFDKILCWAVFDVVEQEKSLVEANRILKNGGRILISGKNNNYCDDDKSAFVAERNAKLKCFPNHFTDTNQLISNIKSYGFELVKSYGFERRGDTAINKHFPLDFQNAQPFYEYIIILEKIGSPIDLIQNQTICDEYSLNAKRMFEKAKEATIIEFFTFHKKTFGE
jgi:2-polyprenyl-3-methyl-5-hydroxy-6-metoxy-1,4-benzoquinol methylase